MKAWEQFLQIQEAELGEETVKTWLRSLKILRFDAENLYLEARDTFQVMWFEEHMRLKVQALTNNNKRKVKIHLSLPNAKPKIGNKKKKTLAEPDFAVAFEELDPHCTFEAFHSSEENHLPYELFAKITGEDFAVFNPVYIYGKEGSGKTHFLMALAHTLRQQGKNALYIRAETFTEHVVSAIRAGQMSAFRHAYRNIDALLVDDIHIFSRKSATQEEFFHTFNTLHMAGKQIILSANCPPGDLQDIEPRLVSRFEWGIALQLYPLHAEATKTLLMEKSKALNFPLHPKVADYLYDNFKRSHKALNRALEALILRTHLNKQTAKHPTSITPLVAKHTLKDLLEEEERQALTTEKILNHVVAYFGITREDLQGKNQSRQCVLPRQIAMYLCRDRLKAPFKQIGRLFGRDHSTVMTSIRRISHAVEAKEPEILNSLYSLIKQF